MMVLVTGGTGYIGSHVVVELLNSGHQVIIVDNLGNSSSVVIDRIKRITGKQPVFIKLDLKNKTSISKVFKQYRIEAVIHLAGFKSVAESVEKPLEYYENNILSTIALCEAMQLHNVKKLIFSSSATVYGYPEVLPLTETCRVGIGITNPYGQTKFMIEQILQDLLIADPGWQITSLRYFNPIGAHISGLIGEDPQGPPNNLMPYIAQVAVGIRDKLEIFGHDYDTVDGTGVRDYLHVVDLARGHLAALEHFSKAGQWTVYNLGTGIGYSVLEVIKAFESATGKKIKYKFVPRRSGDLDKFYADPSKAKAELKWQTKKSLADACRDSWRWQQANPQGYKTV